VKPASVIERPVGTGILAITASAAALRSSSITRASAKRASSARASAASSASVARATTTLASGAVEYSVAILSTAARNSSTRVSAITRSDCKATVAPLDPVCRLSALIISCISLSFLTVRRGMLTRVALSTWIAFAVKR
jgi:hypothetical protein